jgi:hypothetical protein
VHGEKGKTGLIQKLPGFSAERASLDEGNRRVTKCLLRMNDYNPMGGFDNIVWLEASKSPEVEMLTEKTGSCEDSVSSVSKIDNIYSSVSYSEDPKHLQQCSPLKSKNGLRAYTIEPDNENNRKNGISGDACKLPSSIDQAITNSMEEERKREAQYKTPSKCEECGKSVTAIYEIGSGEFVMKMCKSCYDAYLDDISP